MEFGFGLHVIYGESGVGKSSLVKAITGNEITEPSNYSLKIESGLENVQIIFQNPEDQIISDTLNGELAFAFECRSTDSTWIRERVNRLKSELNFIHDGGRHPVTLSGGEKEILNVATALSCEPKLLLVDDGLSFLNQNAKKRMVRKFQSATKDYGTIILWFTSDWRDLGFGLSRWELTLSSLHSVPYENGKTYSTLSPKAGEMDILIKDLTYAYHVDEPVFQEINVHQSGIRSLGIVGGNGSGKTTLAHILAGGIPAESGRAEVQINGNPVKIGMLDQFPERMLGVSTLSDFMDELITAGHMDKYHVTQTVNMLESHQIPWETIKESNAFDISWATLRLALTVILAQCSYPVLILDEPTFGFGRSQVGRVLNFLNEILTSRHLILISHDREFVNAICDGVLDLDITLVQKRKLVRA